MWLRFADELRCVVCRGRLELEAIESRRASVSTDHLEQAERFGIDEQRLVAAVDTGLLLCRDCRLWFPVHHGLPIMLPYSGGAHEEFLAQNGDRVRALGPEFRPPSEDPARGEEFVLRSFSTEWLDYEYDGVLWAWTYEDRERLFLAEMGAERPPEPCRFLEIGCGLGVVTAAAARCFPGDAVGIDLSLAAIRAAAQYADHPFLHFANASLWNLPLERESFDLLYSHGVLHHTYSTRLAFEAVADFCKPNGRAYIWVYGDVAKRETMTRRIAYAVEMLLRPILSRLPSTVVSAVLAPFAVLYIVINWLQRRVGRVREPYNYSRALHAARDRLTPLYAHHDDRETVEGWFRSLGFSDLHFVTQDEVPASARESMRRNVGIRGHRMGPGAST